MNLKIEIFKASISKMNISKLFLSLSLKKSIFNRSNRLSISGISFTYHQERKYSQVPNEKNNQLDIKSSAANSQKETNGGATPETNPNKQNTIRRLLKIKDRVDMFYLIFIGFGIFYGYRKYKEKIQLENDLQVEWVSMPKFKIKHAKLNGYYLPEPMVKSLKKIKDYTPDKNDVWIISFPKSGTTWLQEIVFLICNDCDFEKAKSKSIEERVPFIEYPMPGIEFIKKMPERPRLIKTHLPLCLLPDKLDETCKVKLFSIFFALGEINESMKLFLFFFILNRLFI